MIGWLSNIAHLTVWLALLAALFVPLEQYFSVKRRVGARYWSRELAFYYVNGVAPSLLMAVPLAAMATISRAMLPVGYLHTVSALPSAVRIGFALIVAETGSYWAHRWCHSSPLLWRFHAIHHSVVHLDWLANTHAHPLDVVFTRLCGLAPLFAFGLAGGDGAGGGRLLLIIPITGAIWSFFVHANVRWRFGWMERLIATPAFHHWHHTNDIENRDRNFAAMFPLLDALFGTLILPQSWPQTYGIDEAVSPRLSGALLDPLLHPRSGPSVSPAD